MKALFTKTLAVLLSAMLLFTAVPFAASAATTAEQSTGASSGTTGSCTWTLDDEGTLTISGNGAMENYYYDPTLPWGKNITNVVIENGVTSIGSYAFYKCTGLTSVTIPDSVTSIGSSAFYNTAWYNNQPDGLVYAGKVAYKYKGTMPDNTSIVLKDGTKGIADSAFSGCTGLTSVTIPDSVTSIGNSAFSGCTGLTSVTIENSVTSIGNHAFEDCTGLKGVYLTDLAAWCNIKFADSTSNPLYYAHKLYLNNQLVTDLEIPDSVTSIGGSTFKNCTELKEITIPDSVTSIESSAFSGCTGLTSVTIPDSVTSIGEDAFYGCTALANITIPDSVTSIGECAFYGCTGLTIFGSSGSYAISYAKNYNIIYQPLDGTSGVCTWTLDDEGTLTISGNGAMANYYSSSTLPWGRNITNVVIENGVTSIGSYAFHNCTGLTSVTIPDSVTSIEKSAFYRCTGLESITIGNSVTSIGSYAFYGCTGLTSVTIGNGVTSIEKSAFSGCKGLTSISVPDSVVYIGDNALSNCSEDLVITCFSGTAAEDFAKRYGIQTDIIPFAVNKLENKTFEITGYTGNSKDVVIPDKILDKDVTSISKWAFANNTKIESVVIPDSITAIAKGAFYNCTELKTVTMGGNVTEIGANAFEKCLYLEEINLSDKLTTIGDAAF
ncbi:MAG: leucine-rich repeat domain-containing protein, partial [Ruminococcus sp.]|nr:leucine-rich repeat domain-containing protein [Ruminococcus sp.]